MNTSTMLHIISGIDEDLIDNYFEIGKEIKMNKAKTNKKSLIKWSGITAACICLVLSIAFIIPTMLDRSAQIPIDNYTGNVSLSYTSKTKFPLSANDMLVYYSEQELFENTDCVFSGYIDSIRNIEIDYDGKSVYKSLISITLDTVYQGDVAGSALTILAAPISSQRMATDEELLSTLKEGEYGIFLVNEVATGTYFSENNCSFDASEICDAVFIDGVRFGFIQSEDADARCCDTLSLSDPAVFTSLGQYDWDSVVRYIEMQCSKTAQ